MPSVLPGTKAEAVYKTLLRYDFVVAENFRQRFSQLPQCFNNRSEIEQLNTFWRSQVMTVEANTIAARECLCQSEDFGAWLDNFVHFVLPVVLTYGLLKE
jgi:hypothetical protein